MPTEYYHYQITTGAVRDRIIAVRHEPGKAVCVDQRNKGTDILWEIKLYLDPTATIFQIPKNTSILLLVAVEFGITGAATDYQAYVLPSAPGTYGNVTISLSKAKILGLLSDPPTTEISCLCPTGEKTCPEGTVPDCNSADCMVRV